MRRIGSGRRPLLAPATDPGPLRGQRQKLRYTPRVTASSPDDRDIADLRAFLAERDVACPGCGYNLRGCKASQCPECGDVFSLGQLRASLDRGDRQRSPVFGFALVGAWVVLFASSFLRVSVDRSGDGQVAFIMLPAMLGVVPALLLAALCLPAFSPSAAGLIRTLAVLGVLGMAALAMLVWL
jgi:hypothetical protein